MISVETEGMVPVAEQIRITPVISPNQSETIILSGVKGGNVEIDIPQIPSDTPIYPLVTIVSVLNLPTTFTARDDIDTVLNVVIEDANGKPIVNFVNNPLTIRVPFDSNSLNPPDTIALVDSTGITEFLATQIIDEDLLEAQVTQLSYVLPLRNSQPTVANPIANEPLDVPIEEDAADKIIDLSGVFDDLDIGYGDQLSLAATVGSLDTSAGDGLSVAVGFPRC